MTNFTECEARFSANTSDGESLRRQWGWNGTVIGIVYNNMTQISREGCIHVCGSEPDIYAWRDISGVITTWVLPTIGILLQAPFESNKTRQTLLAITRWVGSPIASLSYILWNIKVSAKAALMVDMSVQYDEPPDFELPDCTPDCTINCTDHHTNHRTTHFGSMRDSMYLLLVMNQYTLKSTAMPKDFQKEAECLLRITLFSKDLKMTDTDKTLDQMRRILAQEVRETRRRGVVPVFVSILWFLFAFALSIQDAFSELGANTTAHDLALGCLLAWFPVLIMGSIVDRNPIAAEAIRKKLNTLVNHVRCSLRNEQNFREYLGPLRRKPNYHELKATIESVPEKAQRMDNFFLDFAGQARVRWHYGAAHAILCDIETCYIQKKGRNWLENEEDARVSLVLGTVNEEGLVWFDFREFWQIISAVVIVGGSCGGAFILSFFTPTIGLGCRSGGYTIFFIVALGLLIVEMSVWMFFSLYEVDPGTQTRWERLTRSALRIFEALGNLLVFCTVFVALKVPYTDKGAVKERVEDSLRKARKKWEVFFFRPVEIFNTMWLIYIVMAQVLGYYRTCDCITSNWAWGGGYLDFSQQFTSNSYWIAWCWISGTSLTASVMGLSMLYITVEWCQQSFLSTENYLDAVKGLRMTRTYRSWTLPARHISRFTLTWLRKLAVAIFRIKKPRKTLMWSRHVTSDPVLPSVISSFGNDDGHSIPLIEQTDYDAWTHDLVSSTPAITASNEKATSVDALNGSGRLRSSHDSSTPLTRTPSQEHQQHETEHHMIGTEQGNEEAPLFVQGRMRTNTQTWPNAQDLVLNRQGYHRANSDPGLLHE